MNLNAMLKEKEKEKKQEQNKEDLGPKNIGNIIAVIREIEINKIIEDINQPRKNFEEDKIDNLAESIQKEGLLQPIIVRSNINNFIVIAGHRRLKAFKKLGKITIPAIIKEMVEEKDITELQLIENLQRENLNVLEIAETIHKLTKIGLKAIEISKDTGYSKGTISDYLKVYRDVGYDKNKRKELLKIGIVRYRNKLSEISKSSNNELFMIKSLTIRIYKKTDIDNALERIEKYVEYLKDLKNND